MNALKSSGIIRRLDDLGRIVVVKELRKHIQAGEGTPCELIPSRDEQNRPIVVIRPYWALSSVLNQSSCQAATKALAEAVDGREVAFAILDEPGNIVSIAGRTSWKFQEPEFIPAFMDIHRTARAQRCEAVKQPESIQQHLDDSGVRLAAYPLVVPTEPGLERAFIGTLIMLGETDKELDTLCKMVISMLLHNVSVYS